MRLEWLLVCLATLVRANQDAKRLYSNLLANYDRLIRPVQNRSVPQACVSSSSSSDLPPPQLRPPDCAHEAEAQPGDRRGHEEADPHHQRLGRAGMALDLFPA